ncbi:MAG: PQQ-binding-like beta-propeller repeat protein [Fidelibacterota bacterium]
MTLQNVHAQPDDWVTSGGRVDRTGRMSFTRLGSSFTLSWKKQFSAGIAGSPIIINDILLLPFLNGELAALQLANGKSLERKKYGAGPIVGLTVSGDTLYFAMPQERQSLRAYDVSRGRNVWKLELGPIEGAPAADKDRLFVGTASHQFYCLDRMDGTILWQKREKAPIGTSPAVISGRVTYSDREGNVYSRESKTGELIWQVTLVSDSSGMAEKYYSYPVVVNERVFLTTLGGSVYALSAKDGSQLWRRRLGDPLFAAVSADSSGVFVPTSSGRIFGLKWDSGEVLWTYDGESIVNAQMALGDSILVATALRGDIIILDKRNGNLLWSHTLKSRILGAPVAHSRALIIADDNRWVYTFTSQGRPGIK